MKRHESWRRVGPLWVGLAVVSVGAGMAVQRVIMLSVPVAVAGIAVALVAPAGWVLWTVAGMFRSLRVRMGRRRPPERN